jgi:Carbohydrate-selective porin, OprB family/S-layer homology domain
MPIGLIALFILALGTQSTRAQVDPALAATPDPMAQVTAVAQLTDIKPTDWAFQALQALIERHGCIAGYPDRTYRGNQAMSRSEFAAALNQCLNQVNLQLSNASDGLMLTQDLQTVQRLQTEFASELATLTNRVNSLEANTQKISQQPFSTTTKLYGQVILGLQGRSRNTADLNPRDGLKDTPDPATQATFGYSTQLTLFTQFSNRSIFLLGLQAGNLSTAAGNANLPYFLNDTYTRLAYESDTNSRIILSDATYRFLATPRLAVIVGAIGVNPVGVFRGPNRYEGAGSGPISSFAQRNPILNLGGEAGMGLDWQVSDRVSVQAVYAAGSGQNPASSPAAGLFNGPNTVGVQVAATPLPTVDWTVYYLHQYNPSSQLGTGVGDELIGFVDARFVTNAIGTTLAWRVTPRVLVGGWVGYSHSAVRVPTYAGAVETFNWLSFINFPDFGGRGNFAGIYFGQPPRITRSDLALNGVPTLNIPGTISGLGGAAGGQPDITYHLEAFYRWQVSANFSLTPGVVVLFNPVQTGSSDTIVVGAVRSTFSF